MRPISLHRASRILANGRGRRVVVAGDIMLDQFVWGKVSRISPEAPVPVVEVTAESFHLGGAANVAHNLHQLGVVPVLVGVRGEDDAGRRLLEALQEIGISSAGLVTDTERPTTVKTRTIAHSQQVVRIDRESRKDLPRRLEDVVLERIAEAMDDGSAVILSDYGKGALTERVLLRSIALARARKLPVLVDPKLKRFPAYRGVSLVTPNLTEAQQATGIAIEGPESLERAARKILSSLRCEAVLVTRGEQGMSLFQAGKPPVHIGATAREVFDVTGAGDTVIATAGFALAVGASLEEAAVLANHAAGIVVGKLGTATTSPQEILSSLNAGSASRR